MKYLRLFIGKQFEANHTEVTGRHPSCTYLIHYSMYLWTASLTLNSFTRIFILTLWSHTTCKHWILHVNIKYHQVLHVPTYLLYYYTTTLHHLSTVAYRRNHQSRDRSSSPASVLHTTHHSPLTTQESHTKLPYIGIVPWGSDDLRQAIQKAN